MTWARKVLFGVLLPVVLVGPVLTNASWLVHSHDAPGDHAHLLPVSLLVPPHVALPVWHHAEHDQTSDVAHGDGNDDPPPPGSIISLTGPVAPSQGAERVAAPDLAQHIATPVANQPWCESPPGERPPDVRTMAWTTRRSGRSVIADLLQSSHALLI